MSSAPDEKPEGEEAARPAAPAPPSSGAARPARPPSPGRYSMSTEGSTEVAAVRIDSTRMPAVHASSPPASKPARAPGAAPPLPAPPPLPAGARAKTAPMPGRPPPLPTPPPSSRRGPPPPPPSSEPNARAVAPPAPPAPSSPSSVRRSTLSFTSEPPPQSQPPSKGTGAAALASARPPSMPPPSPGAAGTPSVRPGSLRPPPPPKRESRPPTFEGFDEGSIAFAFDALMSEGTAGEPARAEVDLAPVRELFAELAANHMRHVRDFMIDVKWGEAPREWIDICVPAVVSLRRAADRLGLGELAIGLEMFGAELDGASPANLEAPGEGASRAIEGAHKDRLLESYEGLVTLLPQAFALDRDKSQREAVIIQSLCLSVPDVRKVTIDKLHAAGLTSLSVLFEAKPAEVAQVAGIPEEVAVRIVERFQAYRRELQNASPQDARAAEREKLATLTAQLREQHDGYEEAAGGWSPDAKAKKRDLFRAREETWLEISLLLARFGEVDRLQGIEKVPFAQRIAQLTEYLEEARDKYRTEG
ncbi:MAG: hypothetical protein KF819_07990 [Labilithrix sp.]|nr:hypothetical protein [Labilithrix sp.]